MNDIYAVISYYLTNRETLDQYLAQREVEAEQLRREIEARQAVSSSETLAKLRQRMEAKRQSKDS